MTMGSQLVTDVDGKLAARYGVTAEQIEARRTSYAGLSADTPRGYEEVRLAIADCRDTRVAVESKRKELKADALEYGRRVDSVAKSITAMIETIEEPLKTKKAAVDEVKARAKQAREAAEKAAIEAQLRAERDAEEQRLAIMREGQRIEAAKLAAERAELEAARAQQREAEARFAAEREAEIAAERAQLAAERAAQERVMADARAADEARAKETRNALAAQQREIDRIEAVRLAQILAEQEAERRRIEAEEARVLEVERQAALAARLDALRPDAEKLRGFASDIRCLVAPSPATAEARKVLISAITALCEIASDLESFGAS